MPTCGSQLPICDVPIRYDTYKGCTHACSYCFVKRLSDITKIELGESPQQLLSFIKGKRNVITSWCDWDIPIHWGGVSDPFQPCESIHKKSYDSLKILAETQYPYIVSTKGKIAGDDRYIDLISRTNVVFQISAVSPQYDKLEPGAPTYDDRIRIAERLSPKVKRMVIRIQPFVLSVEDDIIKQMERLKNIGVYGVILEGMKYRTKRQNTEKFMGDNVIKKGLLERSFERIKEKAHECGIVFLSGENRLRSMGDSLTCCGCGDLDGFKVNTYNHNSFKLGRSPEETESINKIGGANAFITMCQGMEHKYGLALKKMSFKEAMQRHFNKNKDVIG